MTFVNTSYQLATPRHPNATFRPLISGSKRQPSAVWASSSPLYLDQPVRHNASAQGKAKGIGKGEAWEEEGVYGEQRQGLHRRSSYPRRTLPPPGHLRVHQDTAEGRRAVRRPCLSAGAQSCWWPSPYQEVCWEASSLRECANICFKRVCFFLLFFVYVQDHWYYIISSDDRSGMILKTYKLSTLGNYM